jgi:sugar lactone lactonase YvrE
MEAGEINGAIYEWHPTDGWTKVPGSETSGANGVEVSKDGAYIYFAGWGNRTFNRVTRGITPPRRDTVQLDFRMDNIHWGPDGMLIAGGHYDAGINDSRVAKIDPTTLSVTQILRREDNDFFAHSTAAAQIGDELWIGSSLGEHIAVVRLPE